MHLCHQEVYLVCYVISCPAAEEVHFCSLMVRTLIMAITEDILPATGEEYFLISMLIGMYCKADMFLHILWNAKHISMFVENKY